EPVHHEPAAHPRLGWGAPAVLPYRAGQGQPGRRAWSRGGPIHWPGAARRTDGVGLLQRHSPARFLTFHPLRPFPPGVHGLVMTRRNVRRCLLSIAVAAARAGPAHAQNYEAFQVADVRVEGLQRISAGTVFTYLPVERGDLLDRGRSGEAIRALFRTGFFSDVKLERQGDILAVVATER